MDSDIVNFMIMAGMLLGIPGAVILLIPVARAIGRRMGGSGGALDEALRAELEELRGRVEELETAQDEIGRRLGEGPTPIPDKVARLEDRVEFAERVLTQQQRPAPPRAQLPAGE